MKTLIITLIGEDGRREFVDTLFSNETYKIRDCKAVKKFKIAQRWDADWESYNRAKGLKPWRGRHDERQGDE